MSGPDIDEIRRMKKKYPGRCPVIIKPSSNSNGLPKPRKTKFLVKLDDNFGNFKASMRQHFPEMKSSVALFTFVSGIIPQTSQLMSYLLENYGIRDSETGTPLYLIVMYAAENTFGG